MSNLSKFYLKNLILLHVLAAPFTSGLGQANKVFKDSKSFYVLIEFINVSKSII